MHAWAPQLAFRSQRTAYRALAWRFTIRPGQAFSLLKLRNARTPDRPAATLVPALTRQCAFPQWGFHARFAAARFRGGAKRAQQVNAKDDRSKLPGPGREEGSARAFRHASAAVTADAPHAVST